VSRTIGIDARKIRDGGIGRHLQGLLGALAEAGGPDRYVLFAPDTRVLPPDLAARLDPARFEIVPCRAGLYSAAELFAFRGAARRHGLDLLHFPHYVRSFDPGCPVAVTIHDTIHLSHPPSRAAAAYARIMMGWAARSAAVLFAPSEAARADLVRRLRVDASHVVVARNGVDARFAPPPPERVRSFRESRRLAGDFVLCVGTHRRHKNIAAAIEGFRAARLGAAEIVLAAPDERTAARLRAIAGDAARILDGVSDDEMPLLYAAARIVLAPSLAEGFGLGPLEACACGAPVAATAIPAHREVLSDAVRWIDARGRPSDIADALAALWENGAALAALAARGPARAAGFRWADAAEIVRRAWSGALGRDQAPRRAPSSSP
jgi:glycosyltransferase involved in cell wall biosynthesis